MSKLLQRTGALIATAIVGGGAAAVVATGAHEASATYANPWTRTDTNLVASTGLWEGYEYGHSKWINNDTQEAWPTEGADCSGYAGKAWATPVATGIGTDYPYPYTGAWYAGSVDGSIPLDRNDSRYRMMDVWVMRTASGGAHNHMGLYEGSKNTSGEWKIWHAMSEDSGIGIGQHPSSWFDNNNVKRFKRITW